MSPADRAETVSGDDSLAVRLSAAQLDYLLGERRLGRLATADATGRPHVVPVGWSYNRELGTIDISGRNFAATRKYRNVQHNPPAAFVVDDVLPPWRPRCVMVQGTAQALAPQDADGTEAMIRISPRRSPRGAWTATRRAAPDPRALSTNGYPQRQRCAPGRASSLRGRVARIAGPGHLARSSSPPGPVTEVQCRGPMP